MMHIITYYDIIPGKEVEYEKFVEKVASKVMKNLPPGVRLEGAWNPINNGKRIYSLMSLDRLSTLENLIESAEWKNMIRERDMLVTNITTEYLVSTNRREKYGY